MAAAPQWAEVARGALAVIQAIAIVVGAGWAYLKFFRGRIFSERLEASVEATLFRHGDATALRVRAELSNTGAAIVHLKEHIKVVYVYRLPLADAAPKARVVWGEHVAMEKILTAHDWVEAQETVSDEVLATVPNETCLAYRVEMIVASKKNKRWSATAIVPVPTERNGGRAAMATQKTRQADLTEEEEKKILLDQQEQDRLEREERERKEQEAKQSAS